ncbi:unnamed protein product [Cyprideis torosa]|uniref:Vacuolar protein sorting-associated protein 52 homolog n=1 Tax=Cyprideis torosa TaxID=163714 RepID=A0A7R8ZPK8_9CRUS|nr:unnamed protein product [Cyprideis torosa]CAG0894212.1 unnamed protein product [Cyprideis torosa]
MSSRVVDFQSVRQNIDNAVIQEALERGLDLRNYCEEIDKELEEAENGCIDDYLSEASNLASLHNQMKTCDGMLAKMESLLREFHQSLSTISEDIQALQQESAGMNYRLKNRQTVRGRLSQAVDELIIPDHMINVILDSPVTEKEFMEELLVLDQKIVFVREQSFKDARAAQDVREVLEKLKLKAVAKIREFLLEKTYQFRKPLANYQVPQSALLKHKFFTKFLMSNEPRIAEEIRGEYVETLSKMYYSYFKTYLSRTQRLLSDEVATKDDLLGAEEVSQKSTVSFFSTARHTACRSAIFSLGKRAEVLTSDLEASAIVPHFSQSKDQKYSYEVLIRSQLYVLVDNACREFIFLSDFFLVTGGQAFDLFFSVMAKSLGLYQTHMETVARDCWDSIALYLAIHLIYRYRLLCHKRAVLVLDVFFETLLKILWPRFEYVVNVNIQSLGELEIAKQPLVPLGENDLRPHYISRRLAEFVGGISWLNESFPSESVLVDQVLIQLLKEGEGFLAKMASGFRNRKEQLVFWINNYDMMLGIVAEITKEDGREAEVLRAALNKYIAEFVDAALMPFLGGIMNFVPSAEERIAKEEFDSLVAEGKRVSSLIKTFSEYWKPSLDTLDHEAKRFFPNFKNGNHILQTTLTQFLSYYQRFVKILGYPPFKNLPSKQDLPNIHHVMLEVKKHKPTF